MPEVFDVDEQHVGRAEDGRPGAVGPLQELLQLHLALGEVVPGEVNQVGRVLQQPEIHGKFKPDL